MLQKQTLKTTTLELLKSLMADDELQGFYLVGGTALAQFYCWKWHEDKRFKSHNIL